MSQRFFCEEPIDWAPGSATTPHATLEGAEAHHLLHVMRAKIGDRVTLFDGSGSEFPAQVAEVGRSTVELTVLARETPDREAPAELTLGVALPKGDRQKVLIEKLTELGVARLTPLVTERSVAAPKASGLEKLRRGVIEASKQCGRNRLMVVDDPMPLAVFLSDTRASERLIAHPAGAPLPGRAGLACRSTEIAPPAGEACPTNTAAAIGPEGGFTDAEVAAAEAAGWTAASIGPRILRIETAAIAIAAIRAADVTGG